MLSAVKVKHMSEQMMQTVTSTLPGLDANAFCQLYENCRQDMYRYAYYKLGHPQEAEDAVQDAVLEAWRQLGNLRSVGAFRGWIFKILAACCKRRIRCIVREREKTEAAGTQLMTAVSRQDGQVIQGGGSAGEQAASHVALEKALNELTEEESEIVLLSVVAGLTSTEIAAQTDMQPGGVRSKLSRSLAKMRANLS